MADEIYEYRTQPDELGNVFVIESPDELHPGVVSDAIRWYQGQRHLKNGESEQNKSVWISVNKVLGGIHCSWKYLNPELTV